MSNGNQIHWTEDEELLERYVLGHLDRPSREAFDEHLGHCDTCRQAVRHEQVLAAGVRRMGRDSLRTRLASRVDTATTSAAPWMRILAAAAVITIIVGVGTYYRWFATQQPREIPEKVISDAVVPEDQKKPIQEERLQLRMPDSITDDKDASRRELQVSGKRPTSTEQRPLPAPSIEAPSSWADHRSNEKKNGRDAVLEAEGTKPESQEPILKQSGAVTDKPEFAANAIGTEAAAPSEDRSVLWIDGILLEENLTEGQSGMDLESLSAVRKDEARPKPSAAVARGQMGKEKTVDRYSVIQRPLNALPLSQQTRQQYLGGKTVQTQIQRVNDRIQLTLFTDISVGSTVGRQTVVQQTGKDSLIVQINSHTVVYRLPAGWHDKIDRAR